jgi:hypothetical protein
VAFFVGRHQQSLSLDLNPRDPNGPGAPSSNRLDLGHVSARMGAIAKRRWTPVDTQWCSTAVEGPCKSGTSWSTDAALSKIVTNVIKL